MSFDKAKEYLIKYGHGERIMTFDVSTATVPEAARAVGCKEGMIAKTLSFMQKSGPVLIVVAGDCKIDNKKYKSVFSEKARMLSLELSVSDNLRSNDCKNHITIEARKIMVNALFRKSSAFSHKRRATFFIPGSL